jgi:hypothetical protein
MRSATGGARVPRRRKGTEYPPNIPVLWRDAFPRRAEVEDEPDEHKRRERKRARDLAVDHLTKMYRQAEKRNQMDQLDPLVRLACDLLKDQNRGRLPKAKGGRPPDERRRLLIAVTVQELIKADPKKRGAVERALQKTSECLGANYDYVRDIHYDRNPEWRRAVALELARRAAEAVGTEST